MKHYTEEQKSIIRSIDIAKYTPKAALYEQLAEEASELSQAAIKCARCIRKESYTSRTMMCQPRHISSATKTYISQ